MRLAVKAEAPPLTADKDGTLRIAGTRVLLDLVIEAFNHGATPETIVQQYSTLSLGDVYAVVAYYLHHKPEVDEYLAQGERIAADNRKLLEGAQGDLSEIRARLQARRKG